MIDQYLWKPRGMETILSITPSSGEVVQSRLQETAISIDLAVLKNKDLDMSRCQADIVYGGNKRIEEKVY